MTSADIKLIVIHKLAEALKHDHRFTDVSVDNDNDSGEVIFAGEDGIEYVISTSDIRPLSE